ncbi:hypothetical protein BT69DRAFT_1279352 [Atractiella rhizophila]|nr:hypothetical protein BT69DRAFT_1279352 [Atractiella rhizophila]
MASILCDALLPNRLLLLSHLLAKQTGQVRTPWPLLARLSVPTSRRYCEVPGVAVPANGHRFWEGHGGGGGAGRG